MIKVHLDYKDLDGKNISEDLFFNLTVKDRIDFDIEYADPSLKVKTQEGEKPVEDMTSYMEYLTQQQARKDLTKDGRKRVNLLMADFLTSILVKSYGERREDSRFHYKNAEIEEKFRHSLAFYEMYRKLLYEKDFMHTFMSNILQESEQMNSMANVVE